MKHGCLLLAALVVIGCASKPATPDYRPFANDASARKLPKFRLAQVLNASLIEVAANNEVKTSTEMQWSRGMLVFERGSVELGMTRPANDESYPIRFNDNGTQIALWTLGFRSDQYRYYYSADGVYCGDRKTGKIRKIYDQRLSSALLSPNDQIVASVKQAHDQYAVVRFGPNHPPETLYTGPEYSVACLGPNGEIGLGLGQSYAVLGSDKKVHELDCSTFCLNFYQSRQGVFPVGFAYALKNGERSNTPVLWDTDGKPVRISDLCPEFKKQCLYIDAMQVGTILSNGHGKMAIELSGIRRDDSVPDHGPKMSLPNIEGSQYLRTYVLEEIP